MAEALFAVHGSKGEIKRSGSGTYRLILEKLDSRHSWFANRPTRLQGTLSSADLVEGWNGYFGKNPPNSVLSFHDSTGKFKRFAFEQLPPKLKEEGQKLVSRMNVLPTVVTEDEANVKDQPHVDPVTGLRIGRGDSIRIKDPSLVIDDFTLSQITFINNSKEKMEIDYVVGELKAGALVDKADLPAGERLVIAGTTHDKWDLSAQVKVWDKVTLKQGLTVQADNPWYETPQIEINMTGRYYNSSQFKKDQWYGPAAGENWLLKNPAPVLSYKYQNDNPGDGDGNKAWTFVFENAHI